MYKKEEFSYIIGLIFKAIRYYDQIGLLKPSTIDSFTSYQYYAEDELELYKRIEYLKRLSLF